MKLKPIYIFLILVAVIGIFAFYYVNRNKKKLCEGEECCSLKNKDKYTCYCSVKCGPRVMGAEPGDNPVYTYPTDQSGTEITGYGKKCFCQATEQRNDVTMFLKNCV